MRQNSIIIKQRLYGDTLHIARTCACESVFRAGESVCTSFFSSMFGVFNNNPNRISAKNVKIADECTQRNAGHFFEMFQRTKNETYRAHRKREYTTNLHTCFTHCIMSFYCHGDEQYISANTFLCILSLLYILFPFIHILLHVIVRCK